MGTSEISGYVTTRAGLASLLAAALVAMGFVGARPSAAIACDELFVDPTGDAANNAPGGNGQNVENLDIISGGIAKETAAQDPTKVTHFTTQIRVKDLSTRFPGNANASINWYFHWTYDGVDYFSRARIDNLPGSQPVYSFGTYAPPRYVTIDATTGDFQPGPKGAVQVDVPLEAVGAPVPGTATFTKIFAVTSIGQGIPGASQIVSRVDRGPDGEAYGTDYPLGRCQGGGGGELESPGVRLRFRDTTPKRGSTVRAKASLRVCPGHEGTKIQLQRKKDGVFKTIAAKKLSIRCRARFPIEARFRKATFRVRWPKQDEDHSRGVSKAVVVRTHR